MANQIVFPYNDKEYTLEFNRASVKSMERRGFVLSDIGSMPVTMVPMLFDGAFEMHHPFAKESLKKEIYERIGNKQELVQRLTVMYAETVDSLLDIDDEGENEGNIVWEVK